MFNVTPLLRSATIGDFACNSSRNPRSRGRPGPKIIAGNKAFNELWIFTGKRCWSCATPIPHRGQHGNCTKAHVPPHSFSKKQPWRSVTPEFTTVMPWCRECDEAAADLTDCPQITATYSNISKMSMGMTLAELATHQSSCDIRTYVMKKLAKKKR